MDKRHAIKQKKDNHATCSQAEYRIYHVYIQVVTIKMNSDKNTMLKDDRDDI